MSMCHFHRPDLQCWSPKTPSRMITINFRREEMYEEKDNVCHSLHGFLHEKVKCEYCVNWSRSTTIVQMIQRPHILKFKVKVLCNFKDKRHKVKWCRCSCCFLIALFNLLPSPNALFKKVAYLFWKSIRFGSSSRLESATFQCVSNQFTDPCLDLGLVKLL